MIFTVIANYPDDCHPLGLILVEKPRRKPWYPNIFAHGEGPVRD